MRVIIPVLEKVIKTRKNKNTDNINSPITILYDLLIIAVITKAKTDIVIKLRSNEFQLGLPEGPTILINVYLLGIRVSE